MMAAAAWQVLLELAPWLLLGAALSGILYGLLPPGLVGRAFHGRAGVVRAVALGIPLPLCSCGVIPAAFGLRRQGASRGAAVGFLISTPQTGVDSIFVSGSFFGWPFALFKVVAAAVTGVLGGLLTDAVSTERSGATSDGTWPADPDPAHRSLRAMGEHALDVLRSIWVWILVGVVASAAIQVLVPQGFLAGLGGHGPLPSLLVTLAVALPFYVCATASVPIAAALVSAGMPLGSALVFLMAGPATNLATVGAIYRLLGGRALAVYLAAIVSGSLGSGLLLDELLEPVDRGTLSAHPPGWWQVGSALGVVGLLAWFALSDGWHILQRHRSSRGRERTPEERRVGPTCPDCSERVGRLSD